MKRNKLTIPAPSEPVIFKDKYGAEMHIAPAGGGRVLFEIHDGDDVGAFEIDGLDIIPIFTDAVKATGLSAHQLRSEALASKLVKPPDHESRQARRDWARKEKKYQKKNAVTFTGAAFGIGAS